MNLSWNNFGFKRGTYRQNSQPQTVNTETNKELRISEKWARKRSLPQPPCKL